MDNSVGIYTEEESSRLTKYTNFRDQMINVMFKGGVPENNKDIRLANELLMAGEKSIHDTAANRTKHQDNMNKEAILETVAEALKAVATSQLVNNVVNITPEVSDQFIPNDIVEGETSINPEPLDPTQFLEEGEY